MRDLALTFTCAGETLVGVLTTPAPSSHRFVSAAAGSLPARVGVLIVVGGPQYRAGSHRQFTRLARALAQAGYFCLRFDVRGMGDSTGLQQSFESLSSDIYAALDAAGSVLPGVSRWVLWGLCDGASASLIYLQEKSDERVHGLCLINPWVRSEETLAQTHLQHYYGKRLLQFSFWRKLFSGKIKISGLGNFSTTLQRYWTYRRSTAAGQAPAVLDFRQRMLAGLTAFQGPILLALSGNDYVAKEFENYTKNQPRWRQALSRASVHRTAMPAADHTFSDPASEAMLTFDILKWLAQIKNPCSTLTSQGSDTAEAPSK